MPEVVIDLFCKAGGASKGYADAGFEVIGVDIEPQPRYPFKFVKADVLDPRVLPWLIKCYRPVFVHAGPVCKVHTSLKAFSGKQHVNQIPQTREILDATGLPYVIENVVGAPLTDPLLLCGSMFRLGVRRHRLFELGRWKTEQPECLHAQQNAESPMYPVKRYHSGKGVVRMSPIVSVHGSTGNIGPGGADLWRQAMGIPWMVRDELSQAIPPAYTQFLAMRLMTHLRGTALAGER